MTNYFWLVWYRSRTTPGPKHWSLFMTYDTDDQAIGTIYQAEGDGWGNGQFTTSIIRGVQLKGPRGAQSYESRLYLGEMHDAFCSMLKEYCDAATELINEHNAERIIGESNCQDWCLVVIKSLEDARCFPAGTHAKACRCPRGG
ncbi:hypothetical protein QCA50_011444 [Cerrena zonata]|uniref:Uncharacterized protein n=1 Tax=Cerrena zonata TaxID=2478898 RepID=A0AAW0G253_9APHY